MNTERRPRPALTAYLPFIAGLIVLAIGIFVAWTAYIQYTATEPEREQEFEHLREKNRRFLEDHVTRGQERSQP